MTQARETGKVAVLREHHQALGIRIRSAARAHTLGEVRLGDLINSEKPGMPKYRLTARFQY